MDTQNQPQTISSSLAALRSSENLSEASIDPDKAKTIATILAGLAAQFHRDEIGEGQAKMLFAQFAEDLDEFSIADIRAGVKTYRQEPKNRFFPTSGQLREPIIAARNARVSREYAEAEAARRASQKPGGVEADSVRRYTFEQANRPLCWYMRPRSAWKPDWHESDVPRRYRDMISGS